MKANIRYPATLHDAAAALGLHTTTLRYYVLRGVATPDIDSSGRPLFLPRDLAAIREYRAKHGRK